MVKLKPSLNTEEDVIKKELSFRIIDHKTSKLDVVEKISQVAIGGVQEIVGEVPN